MNLLHLPFRACNKISLAVLRGQLPPTKDSSFKQIFQSSSRTSLWIKTQQCFQNWLLACWPWHSILRINSSNTCLMLALCNKLWEFTCLANNVQNRLTMSKIPVDLTFAQLWPVTFNLHWTKQWYYLITFCCFPWIKGLTRRDWEGWCRIEKKSKIWKN